MALCTVTFPKPVGLNVNMLPFIYGDPSSLPDNCRQYLPMIEALGVSDEIGKTVYLSVSESEVKAGESQRRGGVHTEAHGPDTPWGGGNWGGNGRQGSGIFMASTVSNSCRYWSTEVLEPGPGGDCEHLRDQLVGAHYMKANTMYWITDRTPHEAMPTNSDVYRQWFRFVGSNVSKWYAKHSTAGKIQPNAMVIMESKF